MCFFFAQKQMARILACFIGLLLGCRAACPPGFLVNGVHYDALSAAAGAAMGGGTLLVCPGTQTWDLTPFDVNGNLRIRGAADGPRAATWAVGLQDGGGMFRIGNGSVLVLEQLEVFLASVSGGMCQVGGGGTLQMMRVTLRGGGYGVATTGPGASVTLEQVGLQAQILALNLTYLPRTGVFSSVTFYQTAVPILLGGWVSFDDERFTASGLSFRGTGPSTSVYIASDLARGTASARSWSPRAVSSEEAAAALWVFETGTSGPVQALNSGDDPTDYTADAIFWTTLLAALIFLGCVAVALASVRAPASNLQPQRKP